MNSNLQINLTPNHTQADVMQKLGRVLDPELDQSVLELGFITSVEAEAAEAGTISVSMQMPTSWCSPNFAYMMAQDVREELLKLDSVQNVVVKLENNVLANVIEAGVNAGKTFDEAFDGEDSDGLSKLRGVFLRKGYVKRQEALLKRLLAADLTYEEVCQLPISAVHQQVELCEVVAADGRIIDIEPPIIASDYLERREMIGLDCSPDSPLFVNVKGEALTAEKLKDYLIYMRTIRVSMQANGSLCSALLAATNANKDIVSVSG